MNLAVKLSFFKTYVNLLSSILDRSKYFKTHVSSVINVSSSYFVCREIIITIIIIIIIIIIVVVVIILDF